MMQQTEPLRVSIEPRGCLVGVGVAAVLTARRHEIVPHGRGDHAPADVAVVVTGPDAVPLSEIGRTLAGAADGCPAVVVGAFREFSEVEAALGAGALGCVSALDSADIAADAVEAVGRKRGYLSPQIADMLVQGEARSRYTAAPLTPREQEVLRLIGLGRPTRDIAVELGLSPKTVHTHRAALMAKLGVSSQAALLREAIRRGYAHV